MAQGDVEIDMIEFVNAKINIGLQVVNRRENGYHDLQTVFYPVGRYAGTPKNPEAFSDILECVPGEGKVIFSGRKIDCDPEKNLVTKAVSLYRERTGYSEEITVRLEKHLPDGAGMGGGSADGAFTLRMLDRAAGTNPDDPDRKRMLAAMALELGADCPFFIYNSPMYGEGVGEILTPMPEFLKGMWLAAVKPDVYVSTKEAFANITPRPGNIDLRLLPELPIEEWQGVVKNDFEESIFPAHPLLREIKERLIERGALYASMSGSGSSIYGIFGEAGNAREALNEFRGETTIEQSYLLEL